MTEETVVRENLMAQENYSPYCGAEKCFLRNPRAKWDNYKYQFTCRCGWTSSFPSDFIERYRVRWGK